MRTPLTRQLATKALCVVWLFAVVVGSGMIFQYKNTPGGAATTPESWPADTRFALDQQKYTLIMFAHPKCPCTRASIEEFKHIIAECGSRVAAHVAFLSPSDLPPDWGRTDLRRSAEGIVGVSTHADADGAMARQFGAETSGYVVLYDRKGKLLFKGGITDSRGHAGDNVGESTIVSLVLGNRTDTKLTPVFGCGLLDKCEVSPGVTFSPRITEIPAR